MVGGENPRVRFGTLALVCLGLFSALFARLWYLQVMNAPAYREIATLTSSRTLVIPAPRGRILDRNGKVLVDNMPTKVVAVDRLKLADVPDSDAVLSRLAALLNRYEKPADPFSLASIKQTLNVNRVGPYDPVPLAQNVSDTLLVDLTEHASDYPGVVAETKLLRQYHYGSLAAQVLGGVGPITDEAWKAHEHDAKPYQKDSQVGVRGIEQSLEQELRGTDGKRVVEVTPSGKIVRTVSTTAPKPGNDIELTIDINAQATAERALVAQIEATRANADAGNPPVPGAAALLMQPQSGQVLAMASYPTYDPNLFVPSITERDWKALQTESAHSPLTNRVDGGLYSPGSTFKPVTAVTGLRAGIITPGSTYVDNGIIQIDGCTGEFCTKANDPGDGALGPIALPTALTKSSNVYFFNIGQRLWEGRSKFGENAIQEVAKEFGFGKLSGLDLPDEKAVPLPSKQRNIELHKADPKNYPNIDASGNWYTGTNMDLAIGQGDLLVTPLQLGNAYAQIANGGDRFRPTLVYRVLKPFSALDASGNPKVAGDVLAQPAPHKIGHIDVPADWRAAILSGLSGVTQLPGGTASGVFQGFPMDRFPVAGKTGTAETGVDPTTGQAKFSNAFFVGFGPTPKPAYLGVAALEEAGYGASAAAPVVRAMLEPVAAGGTWPTVEPTVPFAPPPATTTTTSPPATVPPQDGNPGGGVAGDPAPAGDGAVAQPPAEATDPSATAQETVPPSGPDTTETTTAGAVPTGGQ